MEEAIAKEHTAGQLRIPDKLRQKTKSKHFIRKIIVAVLIIALLAGAVWYLFRSLKSEYTVNYQPYTATVGTISNSLSFNGTMQAVHNTTYTAESSGTVRAIYVSAGDTVHKGDKLIRLSTGQVEEAEFDGTVNVMNLEVGDSVDAGDTLCQVVDFNHMKTSIRVDEYDINSVHIGDEIRVTTVATEKEFSSSIAAINYVSSSSGSVAYYTATCYIDVDKEVYPGMQVTVTLPQEEADGVVILKADAISFDEENSAFVYTMDEKGNMEKTYITTGVSNGSYTEIKSGITDGTTVYTEVKVESTSGSSLLSSLFGGSNVMGGGMPDAGGGGMPDMSSGGGMPGGGGGMPGGGGDR